MFVVAVSSITTLLSLIEMVFKIAMLNVRSLFPSIDLIGHYFRDFDVICLCETWLSKGHTDNMIRLPGFDHIRQDRSAGDIRNSTNHPKRGGGLVIYYKKELSLYVNIMSPCSKVSPHLEQLWIQIRKPNFRTEIISVIYRPPSGICSNFFEELTASMNIARDFLNAEITILGDINIDYKLRHTNDYKKIKEFERDFQLRQLINLPTRITPRSSSILDIILTDMENINEYGVLDYQVSDHAPIFVSKKKPKIKKSFYQTKGRTYKNYVSVDFQRSINDDMRWLKFWDPENTVDDMWQIVYDIILDAANITCPFVNMKIADENPEWFSQELLEEIHLKDEYFRTYNCSKTDQDWDVYKSQRNRVKFLIKNGKEEFIKELVETNSGNPKKFWRIINNTSGLGKEKRNIASISLVDENMETKQGIDAVKYMNEYYASAGYNLLKDFSTTWQSIGFGDYPGFVFENISEYEVTKLIKDIKISKSSAYSEIGTRLFKDAFLVIPRELTFLFNKCLTDATFPLEWGLAEVTPIPKTGNLTNVKNWRPISQIKLPGKLLERLVHTQLSSYFEDILDKNQHGFRKQKSTGTAIFDMLQDVFQNWNKRQFTSCIFIDYSKAFDTIDHSILLKKLALYGLDLNAINFMTSYLANRKQRIVIKNQTSPYTSLRCGVPQGSILGPLLFIIYTNDLFFDILPTEKIIMYADDTLLLNAGESEVIASQHAQHCFDKVINWCNLNKLTINSEKTKHLCISNKKHLSNIHIQKGNTNLGNVDTYEYLGFNVDRHLTMTTYVDKIIKKVSYKVHTLSIIRRYISERTSSLVYKVMIMPHFDYVDFVIDSAVKQKTDRLERLHKRAIRTIEYELVPEMKRPLEELYTRYNLTSLYQRRIEHLLFFMYKVGKHSRENLDLQRPKIELRSKNKVKFKNKFTNITKVQNSPLYRGVFLWDQLPETLQKEMELKTFKVGIRSLIKQNKIVFKRN